MQCNKNDNIHKKNKVQISDDQTSIDNYRVVATITEYHNISKIFFLKTIIPKFMKIKQLFNIKNVCKNVKD